MVTFKMERGFAASSFSISNIFLGEDADMTNNQESWETNDNAFGDRWFYHNYSNGGTPDGVPLVVYGEAVSDISRRRNRRAQYCLVKEGWG